MTAKAGVAGTESGPIHSGATFVDYDRDGWLDLYVGSYVAFDQNSRRYCNIGGVLSSCPPSAYSGSPNALYHNNGNGTFANVSAAANILQSEGKNLSVGAADYDNDGCIDVVVANSGDPPSYLMPALAKIILSISSSSAQRAIETPWEPASTSLPGEFRRFGKSLRAAVTSPKANSEPTLVLGVPRRHLPCNA